MLEEEECLFLLCCLLMPEICMELCVENKLKKHLFNCRSTLLMGLGLPLFEIIDTNDCHCEMVYPAFHFL